MSLPKVSLLLKRPAEAPAPAPDRRVKPRAAPPPSEDLEAAKALGGLFAAWCYILATPQEYFPDRLQWRFR